jgi:hypothetical protein
MLVDFTDCTPEQVVAVCERAPETVTKEPLESVLLLADFSRAQFSREAFERVKIIAALHHPHLKRSAWVLTENLPKALQDSVRSFSAREIPIFATREEALDYLVS